ASEKRFETVERQQDRILGKLRELDGNAMESRVKEKLGNYCYGRVEFVEILERKMLDRAAHIALKENVLSSEERLKMGSSDVLAIGEDAETGESACVVVEVSGVVEKMDVDRAAERAMLLLKTMKKAVATAPSKFAAIFPKAPTKAYALVVGRTITDEASREAQRKGVFFSKYHNGADVEGR
ncbi:hypothetical protein, partial [Methylacidimicrobium cyclopophantes]|uniref:hypothetical protein n=1 Tax=Methylacidimicrobium cyclopophantes TaxID=1041766 RepID=UPI001C499E21